MSGEISVNGVVIKRSTNIAHTYRMWGRTQGQNRLISGQALPRGFCSSLVGSSTSGSFAMGSLYLPLTPSFSKLTL
jgi:hypothetical protein